MYESPCLIAPPGQLVSVVSEFSHAASYSSSLPLTFCIANLVPFMSYPMLHARYTSYANSYAQAAVRQGALQLMLSGAVLRMPPADARTHVYT